MSYFQPPQGTPGYQQGTPAFQQQGAPAFQPSGNSPFYSLYPASGAPFAGGSMSGGMADAGGHMQTPLSTGILAAFSTSGYPGEELLLAELGINFDHIRQKTLGVLNPLGAVRVDILADADLAGPILFVVLFGLFLLMAGKVQFGYVYGVGLFGTVALHWLFTLMSALPLDVLLSASVIGYSLLPLVFLLALGVVVNLDRSVGYVLGGLCVLWCTYAASGFFQAAMKTLGMRALVAYPLAMFYTVFALMVIFVEN